MTDVSLTILVPTRGGLWLSRCLHSVRQHAPPHTQVIVVCDGLPAETCRRWQVRYPEMHFLSKAPPGGFCRAVNFGLQYVQTQVVQLLNDDTQVAPGFAEPALRHFLDQRIGCVAPLVLQLQHPDTVDSMGIAYHICGWARSRGHNHKLQEVSLVPGPILGASGSSGFYRAEALRKVGGLQEMLDAYYDDVELALRLQRCGYLARFEPQSRIFHAGSLSYNRSSERVIRLIARNEEVVFWMHLTGWQVLHGLVPHLGFVAIRLLCKWWQGQAACFLRGKWEALRLASWIREQRQRFRQASWGPAAVESGWKVLQEGWAFLRDRKMAA